MKAAVACTAMLALTVPQLAFAQQASPTTIHDVQCLIMSVTLAGNSDQDAKAAGLSGTMFFGGKILGAQPTIDLPALARTEATRLDDKSLAELQTQCGSELKDYGTKLQAVGAAMP